MSHFSAASASPGAMPSATAPAIPATAIPDRDLAKLFILLSPCLACGGALPPTFCVFPASGQWRSPVHNARDKPELYARGRAVGQRRTTTTVYSINHKCFLHH